MEVIKYTLSIYSLGAIGVLLFFLWHIARFYEKASGQSTGHQLLFIPTALLLGGMIWHLWHGCDFLKQPVGDSLLIAGGLMLFVFGIHLRQLMTGKQ